MTSALESRRRPSGFAAEASALAAPPLVVLAGAPGAGKGTQCSQLVEQHDMVHVSTGDTLRQAVADGTALGSRVRVALETGRLVPDHYVSAVVAERLARHETASTVLLDGFPRTLGQAAALERLRPNAVGLVVLLVVPVATIHRRLSGRGRGDDADPDVIAQRMLAFERDTGPVMAWYASRGLVVSVDADAPSREVTATIVGHLRARRLCAPAGTPEVADPL